MDLSGTETHTSTSQCLLQETSFDIYAEDLNAGDAVRIYVLEDPGLPNGMKRLSHLDHY